MGCREGTVWGGAPGREPYVWLGAGPAGAGGGGRPGSAVRKVLGRMDDGQVALAARNSSGGCAGALSATVPRPGIPVLGVVGRGALFLGLLIMNARTASVPPHPPAPSHYHHKQVHLP